MVAKPKKADSFKISSPEGVSYICYENDPLYRLKAEMAPYAEEERLLPLALLVDPTQKMEPHLEDRRRLVERIHRFGSKLEAEAVIELAAKLRRLVLADWFMSKLDDNVTSTDEGLTGAPEGLGTGDQPVHEDEASGHPAELRGDDGDCSGSNNRLKAATKRPRKGAVRKG